MTLGIAWIRTVGDAQELVIASDSRLSGGQFWDANPKLMLLPRSDCVLSFCGDTLDAFPLMVQAQNAIAGFEMAVDRSLDITDLKGHLLRVFNHSRNFISNLPAGQKTPTPPDVTLMFSGYSWRKKEFKIWQLYWDVRSSQFQFRSASPKPSSRSSGRIAFMGDSSAMKEAKTRLHALLRRSGKIQLSFDMEPFEVLRDIIRSKAFPSVGGAPQMIKVYEHMNAVPVGVFWPTKASNQITVLGRPLLDYEKVSWGIIDPDKPTDKAKRQP